MIGLNPFFKKALETRLLRPIRATLDEFLENKKSNDVTLYTSDIRLKTILESLSLKTHDNLPGLGVQNLLFIAAELLLLNHDDYGGLRLLLVEELEAHLHPQAQLRLMNYLQSEYNDSDIQIIISTHSTILASKINIKNIILLKNEQAYDLGIGKTKLEKGDYLFLQRFLDVTKANLFFAKGIIMVEGDAESLVIPILAEILGLDLEKCGVSIVNIGHRGFFRYSNIFLREDGTSIGVPISIVTDCDVQLELEKDGSIDLKESETERKIKKIESKYSNDSIRAFVAPHWTYEYSVGLSCLRGELFESILMADKIRNSNKFSLDQEKVDQIEASLSEQVKVFRSRDDIYKDGYFIYKETMIDKKISKAITAHCFANYLKWSILRDKHQCEINKSNMFDLDLYKTEVDEGKLSLLKEKIEGDQYLKYLVDAVKHATEISTAG